MINRRNKCRKVCTSYGIWTETMPNFETLEQVKLQVVSQLFYNIVVGRVQTLLNLEEGQPIYFLQKPKQGLVSQVYILRYLSSTNRIVKIPFSYNGLKMSVFVSIQIHSNMYLYFNREVPAKESGSLLEIYKF